MDKLPEELLSRTFQCLSNEDLGALTRVNKKFSRIVTPLLYANCQLASSNPRVQFRKVRRMLTTLVARPDLRSLVREISIGDWETTEDFIWSANTNIDPISIPELSAIVQCMPFLESWALDDQRHWASQLLDSSQDAMAMTILSMLPNVHSLWLDRQVEKWYDCRMEAYFTQSELVSTFTEGLIIDSIDPPLSKLPVLKNLTSLVIDGSINDRLWPSGKPLGWDPWLILNFLKLPSLKKFAGGGIAEGRLGPLTYREKMSSTVTDIMLYDCDINSQTIETVLRSCRALESFKCFRGPKGEYTRFAPGYSYANLHQYLIRHRVSLRHLHLHSNWDGCGSTHQDGPVGSLVALENLEILEVDEDVLFGAHGLKSFSFDQFLPPNLRHLIIQGEEFENRSELFSNIGRALLSGQTSATIEVKNARVDDAIESLKDLTQIELRELTSRYEVESYSICSFLIRKREDETYET